MAATVLVIDGGGRGSALVAKYLQSPRVWQVLAVPGNDLMLELTAQKASKQVKIFPQLKTTDLKEIKKICKKYKVDLVDVAQDDAVAASVVDELEKSNFAVFGPTKAAGQIEWDKAWARNFMGKNKIPSPSYKICTSPQQGINFIKSQKAQEWFIKASGLAGGKGALYAKDNKQAQDQISQMQNFKDAGKTYLVEECLRGEEFSSFALVDGRNFILIGHAQDHKTVNDGDKGPNTGGMGCSSPPMVITKKIENHIKPIFKKTTLGLVKISRPYTGILYLGGMIDKKGKVFVIEFNARWGDPEAEVIVPAIENDFFEIAQLTLNGKIKKIKFKKDNLYRVTIAAASKGYPQDYSKAVGKQIHGLEKLLRLGNSIQIFGAGVKKTNGKFTVCGGRLFYVTAADKNVI